MSVTGAATSAPPETPDRDGAFPRLTDDQLARLAAQGERRSTQRGEVLFRQGDIHYDFYVVLEGRVATVDGDTVEPGNVIAVHGSRRFLGELSLLIGQAAFYAAIVVEPGEVLVLPVERVRALVAQDPVLGDVILRAYLLRRDLLIGLGAGLRILGSRFSPDTRRLREFVARNRLPHRWIDLEQDPGAESLLCRLGVEPRCTPIVIWGGRVMRNPATAELAEAVGLKRPAAPTQVCDLIVVGAGPAGLAAAVYGASEGLDTVVTDGVATGGQAATSSRIENYLGFPSGLSGAELAERATLQAEKFGAQITVPGQAVGLEVHDGLYGIALDDGGSINGRTVLIATGARYRKLPLERLEHFEGTSVHYAATPMEATMCRGDPVAVVGGGNSAGQAVLFLARHVPVVRLLVRHDDLARDMSRYLADRIEHSPTIEVRVRTEVRELVGGETLEALVVADRATGETQTIEARALFVFIGADPHTEWLGGQVALDEHGFVLTGSRAGAEDCEPSLLETSRPGVFAAGDVRSGSTKRVAAAVGEGSMVVRLIHTHLVGRGDVERPPL
jgi:thioredoxin reductase (NADPH)